MEFLDSNDSGDVAENAEIILMIKNQSFRCERHILVQNSPYFEAMFNSGMMESTAKVVELKGVCPQAMETIIRFLKTGQFDCCPFEHISSLLEAAVMYQFAEIRNRCIATLQDNLNVGNCLGVMFLTAKFDIDNIHREAKQIALWNCEAVLQEPEFTTLLADQVVEYLSHDGLKVTSEDVVLKSVLRWMNHDVSERIQHYENLFSAVRFSALDLKTLKTFAHDQLVHKFPKIERLVHEIWKIKSEEYLQANDSPLSVSPLSNISPADIELDDQAGESHTYSSGVDCVSLNVLNINVEQVIAQRLLSTGPRSIPMVPALVLCNSQDKSEAPILVYYDVEKRKPVEIDSLSKVFHTCGKMFGVANGFKACAVENCVYLVGGEFMMGHGDWNNSVWKYNTFVKSWAFLVNLKNPRRHHELCIVDGGIYLIGGIGRYRVAQDTVQRLDISSGDITDLTPMPVPVTSAAVTAYQGRLYIFESCVYRYNSESNTWKWLKSVSLPHHGFHSALPHSNGIYLVGRCSTQLSLYTPECLSDPYHEATFTAVGNFQFPTENACLVGNKIYSFSKTELLNIESYDIETNIFAIEYSNEDGSFLGPQYQHGCFALLRY